MSKTGYCARKGCPQLATHALRLIVPYQGNRYPPFDMVLGLYLCQMHAAEEATNGPRTFLAPAKPPETKSLRNLFDGIMRGLADFARAELVAIPMTDPMVSMLERASQGTDDKKPN